MEFRSSVFKSWPIQIQVINNLTSWIMIGVINPPFVLELKWKTTEGHLFYADNYLFVVLFQYIKIRIKYQIC
jgi:hypothetical protein